MRSNHHGRSKTHDDAGLPERESEPAGIEPAADSGASEGTDTTEPAKAVEPQAPKPKTPQIETRLSW